MVKEIKTKAEFDTELKSNKLVIVDFTASWCPPCRMIGPKFEALEGIYTDCVFLKVDVHVNSETAESEKILAMPTFRFYKNGSNVDELVGASEVALKQRIEKNR